MSSSSFTDLGLSAFVERVADHAAIPGAGSVAAVMGGLGAGLASMAFRRASGEGQADAAFAAGRASELDELRATLLRLADDDAHAYEAWLEVREVGGEASEKALDQALEVPLEIMEGALAALRLLAVGHAAVPVGFDSERRSAAHSLGAAIESAGAVVAQNLVAIEHRSTEDLERTLASLLRTGAALVQEVTADTQSEDRGADA